MPVWLDVSIFALIQFVMLVGLFGLIVPVFPGLLIMWLAALGYGIITGFDAVAIFIFVLITLLVVAASLIDNVFMGAGARKGGAAWGTIAVAMIAGVVGTIMFPPLGGLVAAPLAVLLLEYIRKRDIRLAWRALVGMATGLGLSFVVRFGVGVLVMILWWVWVWSG
jgi:uncharacterized protein YqgC (DUF456 family)